MGLKEHVFLNDSYSILKWSNKTTIVHIVFQPIHVHKFYITVHIPINQLENIKQWTVSLYIWKKKKKYADKMLEKQNAYNKNRQ